MRKRNILTVLLVAASLVGCISSRRVEDRTANQPATCEVHHVAMIPKRVEMTYGMKRDDWTLALRFARRDLFPHADEVYDTYACCPSYEKYARVYVCADCTETRAKWLQTHPQRP